MIDGNHRALEALLRGERTLPARVGYPGPVPDEDGAARLADAVKATGRVGLSMGTKRAAEATIPRYIRASSILPPHEVGDHVLAGGSAAYLSQLRLSYMKGDPVTPIVVIPYRRKNVALVGSHRVHAMQKVFGSVDVPLKYVLVVPLRVAEKAVAGDPLLEVELQRYLLEQYRDTRPYEMLLQRIATLSPELHDALKDQW